MTTKALITISVMLAYFVINAVIIKIGGRKQVDLESYAVGSRSFGYLLNAFSYLATWYVGAMYVGWFANAATIGVFAQYIIIYSAGSMAVMYYMSRPVWIWGKLYGLETEGDYIRKRYDNDKFRFILMAIIFVFYAPWLVVEIKALGYIVQAATYYSVSFNVALIAAMLFVTAYTFIGGARATALGGLVQGVTIGVVGLIFIYCLIAKAYGGIGGIYQLVEEFKPQLLQITAMGSTYWSSIIIVSTLGGFALPAIFYRMYMTDSPRTTKKSVLIAPILGVLMGFLIMALGLPATLLGGFPEDPQTGSFWLVDKLAGPVGLGFLGVLGMAAAMGGISVQLNCFAVMISKDIIGPLKPNLNRNTLFKVARVSTILIAIICLVISMFDVPNLMFFVIGIYDCCVQIFPMVFLGMFWRRANIQGAIIGFILGSIWAVMGNFFPDTVTWAGGWTGGFIGLVFNFAAMILCGFIFKKTRGVDEMFDKLAIYKEPKSQRAI